MEGRHKLTSWGEGTCQPSRWCVVCVLEIGNSVQRVWSDQVERVLLLVVCGEAGWNGEMGLLFPACIDSAGTDT
jgi:hypothetical protein